MTLSLAAGLFLWMLKPFFSTLILSLIGTVFGNSFDWRAEVIDEFKDSRQ